MFVRSCDPLLVQARNICAFLEISIPTRGPEPIDKVSHFHGLQTDCSNTIVFMSVRLLDISTKAGGNTKLTSHFKIRTSATLFP